jgi:hypothetical protein
LHAAVDGPARIGQDDFSPLKGTEFKAKLEKLRQGIADRESEFARREIERRKEEADAELAASSSERASR